ncbi:MAG: hypothetical protein FWF07_00340 [Methanomassiliicoccaceae archaeon]|nr:hypothetical protein [Methanomassiliicoccaceae archaeon]
MVVKSKRGRVRYIAFDVPADLRKDILIKKVNSTGSGEHLYVVQCASGKAVVRCSPAGREEAVRILTQAEPSCVSLMTSGTLHKIRERYPELKVTKK